jgi:formate hydrogenlyase subunit 6/NADH:ubiquinone oxidoreductase subunit I
MPRILSLLYLLPQLLRTLFSKSTTTRYPFEPLDLPSCYRGRVTVDPDLCRGCGLCVRDCPASGLELRREARDRFELVHHPDRCVYCAQCEDSCPAGAISLINEFMESTPQRNTLTCVLVKRDEDPAEN